MQHEMHLFILASGSKGNAAVVEGPDGSVLIDCGISRRQLFARANEVGCNLEHVKAVVVTHEHGDHTAGLKVLRYGEHTPVLITEKTASRRELFSKLPCQFIDNNQRIHIAGMQIDFFSTSHDVADPIGMRFSTAHDAIGFCTDTGYLPDEARQLLKDTRVLALEANHDTKMLEAGPYPRRLKQRVGGDYGHLSNDQAAHALKELIGSNCETVVAMHLSEQNNTIRTCMKTLADALGATVDPHDCGHAVLGDHNLELWVAYQDMPRVFL